MNNARMRMIGSGTPINQSKAPLPNPMLASIVLALLINPGKFHGFPAKKSLKYLGSVWKYLGSVWNGLSIAALA
jgi:hypothetical protein